MNNVRTVNLLLRSSSQSTNSSRVDSVYYQLTAAQKPIAAGSVSSLSLPMLVELKLIDSLLAHLFFSTCQRKFLNCFTLMTQGANSRRNSYNKPSINYKFNPHGGPSFDVVDVTREDYAPNSHNTNTNKPPHQAEARSPVLSTAYVISGVGQLWNFATSSIPVRQRTTSLRNTEIPQQQNKLNIVASISSEGQNVSVNLQPDSHVLATADVQKRCDLTHVTDKLGCFGESHIYHYLLRCMHNDEKRVSSVRVSDDLRNIYGWMKTIPSYDAVEKDNLEISDTENATTSENGESLCTESTKSMIERDTVSQHEEENDLFETKEGQKGQFTHQESKIFSSPLFGLAKQEHAFAGAFAGTFVSLCLHPMDTVKTVVQSCNTDHRSIPYISKSIISERGLLGLYRGIASNIASSAPISAIYTFSYESVKAALLPLLAKEYHSLAHCVAGGCASVATSFVFTPSERIKQQMQVGSHYRTCWNALLGIVGKGGFLALYNGWGAVLCRNVPHSIIKFYTYESLKNVLLTSNEANGQPTTISTLFCGGLAGSTAALFTTPFDVVKTRLQTQIPGSVNRYNGVYNTLTNIAQNEGLMGLYRGLTPRLVMYMTQGALFFASYESFKRLLSLEATRPESTSKGL